MKNDQKWSKMSQNRSKMAKNDRKWIIFKLTLFLLLTDT